MSDRPDDEAWLLAQRRAIGNRIRAARMDQGLTQEQVFLAIPLSRSVYQEIESGQGNPTVNTMYRIARVLRCPITDLLN